MTDRPPRGTNPGKPSRIDTSTAHSARIYNYWLGGKDNFPADREAAEAAMAANPGIVADVRANRAFLARAVRYLVGEAGVRQFLDIGTGLPTADNTHEVAQAVAPESRIVYVDNDPIVLTHARALLSSTTEGAAAFLDADLREPELILKSAARTLDLGQPVALMLLIILHLIPDAAMAEMTRRVNERMRGTMATLRTHDEVAALFGGLKMIEPGVVQPQQWRPGPATEMPAEVTAWCGVALKS